MVLSLVVVPVLVLGRACDCGALEVLGSAINGRTVQRPPPLLTVVSQVGFRPGMYLGTAATRVRS